MTTSCEEMRCPNGGIRDYVSHRDLDDGGLEKLNVYFGSLRWQLSYTVPSRFGSLKMDWACETWERMAEMVERVCSDGGEATVSYHPGGYEPVTLDGAGGET